MNEQTRGQWAKGSGIGEGFAARASELARREALLDAAELAVREREELARGELGRLREVAGLILQRETVLDSAERSVRLREERVEAREEELALVEGSREELVSRAEGLERRVRPLAEFADRLDRLVLDLRAKSPEAWLPRLLDGWLSELASQTGAVRGRKNEG